MTNFAAEVLTAAPVPFDGDGALRMDIFIAMLKRAEAHTSGVFVSGTTAEFPALEDDERRLLLLAAVDVYGADRVVAHVGDASLRQVLRHAATAAELGVKRMAVLTPYYLPCDFQQIQNFYQVICAEHPEAEVFAYLFPERSGLDVSPEEWAELSWIPGMAGVKLSGRPNGQFQRYVELGKPGARVYSGDDSSLPSVMAAGGAGVVSGVSSAYPELFGALIKALAQGNEQEVASAQAKVVQAVQAAGPSITRLKYALSSRFGETWTSRMSLPAVTEAVRVQIDEVPSK